MTNRRFKRPKTILFALLCIICVVCVLRMTKSIDVGLLSRIASHLDRKINFQLIQKEIVAKVTVLVFSFGESQPCLKRRVEVISKQYPGIRMIVASSASYENPTSVHLEYMPRVIKEGEALKVMLSKVNTEYFLYLSPGVHLADSNSDTSVTWLFHALEKVPEIDFIGGSYRRQVPDTKYPVLEIPCHRLRMCNWTLSQTLEYRYSVGDVMICEETSSSFMGRLSSVSKVGEFDSHLDTMATTDFFLRSKGKVVTGLRPEVQFLISGPCVPSKMSVSEEANSKFAFLLKHQLYIHRDSFGHETNVKDSRFYSQVNYGRTFWEHGTYAHPLFIRGLHYNLKVAADFLESKNISYYLDAGLTLGGVKMRGILPWDRDVDVGFYGDWRTVHEQLKKYLAEKGIKAKITSQTVSILGAADRMELHVEAGDFGYADLIEQSEREADPNWFMYIHINGRKYPVHKTLFTSLRSYYGLSYLEMHGTSGRFKCDLPEGHHACLPHQYAGGGGHWREFYCEL